MTIAYLDCFSGMSGDMFLGALLDAGLSFNALEGRIKTLRLKGYHLEKKQEARNQISGTQFLVRLDTKDQPHRSLKTIREIIHEGDLSDLVKDKSIEIFEALAKVEGEIHNSPPEEIQFHEVGAMDSIIDVVGTVYGIEEMDITSLFVSPLPLGKGFVETAHGRMPIPAPATIALLKGIPVYDSGVNQEMVTPTGAALLKGLAGSFGTMPDMRVGKVGYGIGSRELPDRPNLVRILLGNTALEKDTDTIVLLEANLDDANPEWLGFLMERLLDAGALDVIFCPVQMKKNRPGVQVQVVGRPHQRDALMHILFQESSTLGVRFQSIQRRVLERSTVAVESPWGSIQVKKVINHDGSSFFTPEYDACREIALKQNRPLKEIFYWVMGLNKKS